MQTEICVIFYLFFKDIKCLIVYNFGGISCSFGIQN